MYTRTCVQCSVVYNVVVQVWCPLKSAQTKLVDNTTWCNTCFVWFSPCYRLSHLFSYGMPNCITNSCMAPTSLTLTSWGEMGFSYFNIYTMYAITGNKVVIVGNQYQHSKFNVIPPTLPLCLTSTSKFSHASANPLHIYLAIWTLSKLVQSWYCMLLTVISPKYALGW